jgi:hypothetical protein
VCSTSTEAPLTEKQTTSSFAWNISSTFDNTTSPAPRPITYHLYNHPELSSQSTNINDDLIEIPHSTDTLSGEYNFTHLLHTFPTMFPYGKGGMGDLNRGRQISWEIHINLLLWQSHQRFSEHEIFMFVVFNILQRRKICL